jgi:hypothetical protein
MDNSQDTPKMDETNVPNLLKVGEIDTNMVMNVDSSVVEPIVINQNTCRFKLTNKGFMSSDSKLVLGLKANTNASLSGNSFMALNLGCYSLIKRISFSVGGNTVSEIDDVNFFKCFESMFVSSDVNKDRETVLTGRTINHEFNYQSTYGSESNTQADDYRLDLGVEYTGGAGDVPQHLRNSNAATFSIPLSELIPMLKGINLPLFQMKQECIIDIVWEDLSGTGRCCVNDNSSTGIPFEIDTNEVKLVIDTIYYDGNVMATYDQKHSEQQFSFNDYRLTKTSLSVDDAKNSVRNIGGAGRTVTKVITGINDDNRSDKFLLNKYSAVAPDRDYVSATKYNGTLTTNIRMNDHFIFPIDLSNSALLFDVTARAQGGLPFVTREEFSGEGNILDSATVEGHALNGSSGLLSNFFWTAYKLPAGRVNSRGLELTTKLDALPTLSGSNTYTQRTWIEIKKLAELKDGYLTAGFD